MLVLDMFLLASIPLRVVKKLLSHERESATLLCLSGPSIVVVGWYAKYKCQSSKREQKNNKFLWQWLQIQHGEFFFLALCNFVLT